LALKTQGGKVNLKRLSQICCCLILLAACTAPTNNTPATAPMTLPAPHQDTPQISLTTTASAVAANEILVVNVNAADIANLFGVEFHLKFNPVFLEVVDADETTEGVQIAYGDFFTPGFVAQNQVDNLTGTVTYVGIQVAPAAPVTGSGTLATLVFRGKAQGPLELELTQVLLATPNGEAILAEVLALEP